MPYSQTRSELPRGQRVAILACLIGFSSSIAGQTPIARRDTLRVTLGTSRARALRANPDLTAARNDTSIARGELRQSGLLRFNPIADALAPGGGNGVEFGLLQEVELLGQRRARVRVARAGFDRSDAAIANATRVAIGDVDRAFYRLYAAAQQTQLADELLSLNQRLASVAQRQLGAGEISRLDYNFAVVEFGRSRSRALVARREREEIALEFRRLLGVAETAEVEPVLDSTTQHTHRPDSLANVIGGEETSLTNAPTFDIDSLIALALGRRPDLAERTAAVRQRQAQASLARREALPNLVLRLSSEQDLGATRSVRPGVGITLPVFNLNQGDVQARRAEARQAELDRAALITRLRTEIANAVSRYRSAFLEVEVLETTVLEPARQNRQLLETAYREGKVGLPVLLLIRNQVIDAEREYWASWLAERVALADLAEALATNINELSRANGGTDD